jgi:uncharacterized protein (UPF0332 family)
MTAAQEEMMKKARESLSASGHLAAGGDYDFAVARAYYAMFYAAQALLMEQGRTFSQVANESDFNHSDRADMRD